MTKLKSDAPVRDYDYYELQERGETRWSAVRSFMDCDLAEARRLAKTVIGDKSEFDQNLREFIDLGGSGKFRLVHIKKHCENVSL